MINMVTVLFVLNLTMEWLRGLNIKFYAITGKSQQHRRHHLILNHEKVIRF